jgi:CheY-like chemotaxis protein
MSEPQPVAVLVEDERQIRRFVRDALESEGWAVFEAETLKRGLIEAGTRKPDLVILDLGLPDGNGVDLIRDLRGWSQIPIIVLSARAGETDKIEALDTGADDYLTKPFGVGELLARVRAAQRRRSASGSTGKPSVRRGGSSDADRVPAPGLADRKRRPRAHPQAHLPRSLGPGPRAKRSLRQDLHGSSAAKARRRPGPAQVHRHGNWGRLSLELIAAAGPSCAPG